MKKLLLGWALSLGFLPGLFADEGMWMLPLLREQRFAQMRVLGLELEDYEIYHPDSSSLKDAVVIFDEGCTGEVISPDYNRKNGMRRNYKRNAKKNRISS
jgi:hypothetical protein